MGRSMEVQLRRAQALNMRRAGKTHEEIADALGYSSRSHASKDVSRALDQVIQEAGDQLIRLERERLNGLLSILWPLAEKGDVRAARECVRVLERTHRLMGLDKAAGELRDAESLESAQGLLGAFVDHVRQEYDALPDTDDPGD